MTELDFQYLLISKFGDNESDEIEYKSAIGGFPQSLWSTYSAFANTSGGLIVLGVGEKGDDLLFEGLTPYQITSYKKQLWNSVNNLEVVNKNILQEKDVIEFEFEGRKFITINVPRATRTQRPIYYKKNPYQGTYKRNYEGDYRCTEEEVNRIITDANVEITRDSRILEGFDWNDIDHDSLRQYRNLFSSVKPSHSWLRLDDKELLIQLGGYRIDRKTKQEGITIAGILMFGKTNSITDPDSLPHFFLDYQLNTTTTTNVRWTDRIYYDGSNELNLFQFFVRVLPKLQADLPKPFILVDGIRVDESPAHIAIREALANTLIHADYSMRGNIVVKQHLNEFTFSNPGTLLISKSQYYLGGVSECRNPMLQKMFMLIGGAEKAGSGADKIMIGWVQTSWNTPFIDELSSPDRVTLTMPKISLIPDEAKYQLITIFGEDVIETLGTERLNILAIALMEGGVTNSRVKQSSILHSSDITRLFVEMCSKGLLIQSGSKRGAQYRVNESYADLFSLTNKINNLAAAQATEQVVSNVASSDSNVASNVASSDSNVASNVASSDSNVASKYRKRTELENIILSFLDDFLSIAEIAEIAGKDKLYIKNHIIQNLLKAGKIERKYPEIPKHPYQKYKRTTQ